MTELEQIERDLITLFERFRVKPTYMQTPLGNYRKLCEEHGASDYAVQFLKETKDLPEEAIVVMTPGRLSILVDEDGHLLQFS